MAPPGERHLEGVPVRRVDLARHADALQRVRDRVDLQLLGLRHLLDADDAARPRCHPAATEPGADYLVFGIRTSARLRTAWRRTPRAAAQSRVARQTARGASYSARSAARPSTIRRKGPA